MICQYFFVQKVPLKLVHIQNNFLSLDAKSYSLSLITYCVAVLYVLCLPLLTLASHL